MRIFPALLAFLLVALPASAIELTFSFDGVVDNIADANNNGPAVSVGDYAHGTFVYIVEDAYLHLSSPDWNWYQWPAGSMTMTVNFPAAGESFQLFASDGDARSLVQKASINDFWRTDIVANTFSGSSTFSHAFPQGSARMQVLLSDNTAPYDLLSSTALVDDASDVQLGSANIGRHGFVRADDELSSNGPYWSISWRMDRMSISTTSDPVAVEAKSFGAVKSLY